MDVIVHLAWLLLGLGLLSVGADWLVRGASEVAVRAGVAPLVVGLTVVAFGTSAPELIVSLKANLDPDTGADIAVGNVIGSNICNIALVLGVAALIRPFRVSSQVVKRELPILLLVTAVFIAVLRDHEIRQWEGALMAAGIVVYVWASIRIARRAPDDPASQELPEEALAVASDHSLRGFVVSGLWIVAGLAGLLVGADRLVESGVVLARLAGVPELVIGLTLVAIGTSLPELATTIAATRKGQADLIAGNLIGSNLFNILAVMGITAAVKTISVAALSAVDLAVMAVVTVLLVPFLAKGMRLNRIEGGLLVAGYLAYCVWLVKPEWFGVSG